MLRSFALHLLVTGCLCAQGFFPIEEIRAGQSGTGRTVFSGTAIEEFDVEILGALKNYTGPKSSVILGRLSGGPLERTGVMSGMSGSPVYIDGRLAGAVAFMYPFSKEPLAGIRPIGEMIAGFEAEDPKSALATDPLDAWRERAGIPRRFVGGATVQGGQFRPIATPVSLGGFTERTIEVFAEEFERLGLRPLQGVGGGLSDDPGGEIEPGSMISVGLIRGDMNFTASGTITHVDGSRVFAFGHRFLSSGNTEMPMMRASVMTLVPNLNASFKLSGTGSLIGKISLDRDAGIAGELGPGPSMVPTVIRVEQADGRSASYRMELVRDTQLTPFLLQLALYSAINVSERALGPQTVRVRGGVRFAGGLPGLVLDDIYTGSGGVGQIAALSTAAPLSYLLQTGHPDLELESIHVDVESVPADAYTDLVRAWVSKTQVRPGETVAIRFAAKGPDGVERLRTLPYAVPVSQPAGSVEVTIGDAVTANLQQWRGLFAGRKVRDATATIRFLNSLRGSDRAYLRVWQRKRSLWLLSDKLPAPPYSLHAVLSTPAGRGAGALSDLSTTLEDRMIEGFRGVVRGRLSLRFVVTGS